MRNKKDSARRLRIMAAVLAAVLLAYSVRMADIQLVNNDYYIAQATDINTRTTTLKAARGDILDRYGRPFATTREGYNITLNRADLKMSEANGILIKLTGILEANSTDWVDSLPMTTAYPYSFNGTDSQINSLKTRLGLNHYATAENCWDAMVERYGLTNVELSLQRRIAGIRYSMEAADFSISNPFTLAEDIPSEVMAAVAEGGFDLKGVEITVVAVRQYTDYELAPHIIGLTGPIYAEDWEALKEKGYSYNDKVGKSGIEKAFEDILKGEDGTVTYTVDSSGSVLSRDVTKEPQDGDTIFLTIDKVMQKAALEAFAEAEKDLKATQKGDFAMTGAAAVAVKIDTGETLMSVTYPSYTLEDYQTDYTSLSQQKNNPLFNRAFNGTYSPGSTFKPAVAMAALDSGIITLEDRIYCKQIYTYYADYQPKCLHYHGWMTLSSALSKSCNCYFYEVGRLTGISTLNRYCRMLGLGEYTGVELTESKGILAGPEYSKSVNKTWTDGNVLAAAIGQSDNSFTPLQLATYVATLANGGTRYKTTLIEQITDPDDQSVITSAEPEVISIVDVSDDTVNKVKMGMLSVTEDGTGRAAFADYPIKVGGKTGTAQSPGGAHGIFIAFAPYDNPEIAVAVVLEHGDSSSMASRVARKILDSYFFAENDESEEQPVDTVLP